MKNSEEKRLLKNQLNGIRAKFGAKVAELVEKDIANYAEETGQTIEAVVYEYDWDWAIECAFDEVGEDTESTEKLTMEDVEVGDHLYIPEYDEVGEIVEMYSGSNLVRVRVTLERIYEIDQFNK